MRCAWDAYLNILPLWLRPFVDSEGRKHLQELRMRLGYPPELVLSGGSCWGDRIITKADIAFCINAASRYSPWSAATSAQCYLTAPGGHRIGICGEAVNANGAMTGISTPRYLCIRVARDFPGIAQPVLTNRESVLIIGPPGSGKTTFLRDLVRLVSDQYNGSVAVIDERGELFPAGDSELHFPAGRRTDILSGCKKAQGIEMLLRTMGPSVIAVDEITAEEDCNALMRAYGCGVRLLATAHAQCREDLQRRSVYKPLVSMGVFKHLIILRRDKTWVQERMDSCT